MKNEKEIGTTTTASPGIMPPRRSRADFERIKPLWDSVNKSRCSHDIDGWFNELTTLYAELINDMDAEEIKEFDFEKQQQQISKQINEVITSLNKFDSDLRGVCKFSEYLKTEQLKRDEISRFLRQK